MEMSRRQRGFKLCSCTWEASPLPVFWLSLAVFSGSGVCVAPEGVFLALAFEQGAQSCATQHRGPVSEVLGLLTGLCWPVSSAGQVTTSSIVPAGGGGVEPRAAQPTATQGGAPSCLLCSPPARGCGAGAVCRARGAERPAPPHLHAGCCRLLLPWRGSTARCALRGERTTLPTSGLLLRQHTWRHVCPGVSTSPRSTPQRLCESKSSTCEEVRGSVNSDGIHSQVCKGALPSPVLRL